MQSNSSPSPAQSPATPPAKTMLFALLPLLQALFWGIGNPVMKIGMAAMPTFFCLSMRYGVATLLYALLFPRRVLRRIPGEILPRLLAISVVTAGSFIFSNLSLTLTTATNAGFLMSIAVLFTPFLSVLLLREKLNKLHLIPIAVILAGMYLLCDVEGVLVFGPGELCALLSSVTAALVLVLSADLLARMDPVALAAVQSAVTALVCFVMMALRGEFMPFGQIPPVGWMVIAYSAVFCTMVCYLLQNVALLRLSATFVSLLLCAEPLFSAAAASILLDESLTGLGLLGARLIFAGIVASSLLQSHESRKKQADQQADQNIAST